MELERGAVERWEEDQNQKGRGSGGGSNLQRGNVLARELERDVVALRRSARKGKGCARGGRDYFVTATDNFRSANVTALFASLSAIF